MKYLIFFSVLLFFSCGPSMSDRQHYDLANIVIDSIIQRHKEIQVFVDQDSLGRYTAEYQKMEIKQFSFIKAYSIEFSNIHDERLKSKLSERYSKNIHLGPTSSYSYQTIFGNKEALDRRDYP